MNKPKGASKITTKKQSGKKTRPRQKSIKIKIGSEVVPISSTPPTDSASPVSVTVVSEQTGPADVKIYAVKVADNGNVSDVLNFTTPQQPQIPQDETSIDVSVSLQNVNAGDYVVIISRIVGQNLIGANVVRIS